MAATNQRLSTTSVLRLADDPRNGDKGARFRREKEFVAPASPCRERPFQC